MLCSRFPSDLSEGLRESLTNCATASSKSRVPGSGCPQTPLMPDWSWTHKEGFYCGDIGREYKLAYTINVKLMSPANGIVPGHDKTFDVNGIATCQR